MYTDEFLVQNGAAPFSSILMTPSAFLTDEAWQEIVPKLIKGIRYQVRIAAASFGIRSEVAAKLLVALTFDGFKSHLKNLAELVSFADNNILCAVENRDSSEINQAFDRFVARAGKKRAAKALDDLRRAHVSPIIDQWTLVMVGLAMLRDCDTSCVWESSFIAVNMHPLHRLPFEEFLPKINGFVQAADKFDSEVIDVSALLPKSWLKIPEVKRKQWITMIEAANECFDVDLLIKLRGSGMSLDTLANIFKLYHAVKRIQNAAPAASPAPPVTPGIPDTPDTPVTKTPAPMIMHLYKVPGNTMTPDEKFAHAIKVRNRSLGPDAAITVSPYLNVEVTDDNKRFLRLNKDDLGMYRVLQQSTCRHGKRRRVAKRALTALGDVSGMCGLVNGRDQLREIKSGLEFAASFEEIKHKEKERKAAVTLAKKKKKQADDKKRAARIAKRRAKIKDTYNTALKKLELGPDGEICQHHLSKLTAPQLKVSFVLLYYYTGVFRHLHYN